MIVLGIDPGLTGAWAALDGASGALLGCGDLPVTRYGKTAWIDGSVLREQWAFLLARDPGDSIACFIELVHAMPKNGSQAAFSQGMTFGSILSVIQRMRFMLRMVTPLSWKNGMKVRGDPLDTDRQRKDRSLQRAALMYPFAPLSRVKDHNRAEAILIARYGFEIERKGVAA